MGHWTDDEIEDLIARTVSGESAARERLFEYIQYTVSRMSLRQLGPYRRDPDRRADVCASVVARFLADDHRRLRLYRVRPDRCFPALLRVVATRVAIDMVRTMSQNIAPRNAPARWVVEEELDPGGHGGSALAASSSGWAAIELREVLRLLKAHPDRVAAEIVLRRVFMAESWQEIGEAFGITADAARQRASRLRASLRELMDRHCH